MGATVAQRRPDQAIDYLDAKADGEMMGSQGQAAQAMGLV